MTCRRRHRVAFVLAIARGFAPTPATAAPTSPSDARCAPLETRLGPVAGIEANSLSAAVAAADHWIRRIAPEACPTKVVSVHSWGPEHLELQLGVLSDGRAIGTHLTLHRSCVPETKAACGGRESDWHPMPPEERWLASRVLDAATAWLRAHPEIVQVGRLGLGLGSWSYRRIRTTASSTFCIEDGDVPGEPPSYRACWTDPRPISKVWTSGFSWPARKPVSDEDDRYQYDHVRGFMGLGPFGEKDEVWAVRFPEAERVLVGHRPHAKTADNLRPDWFPEPQRHGAPRMVLPTKGWGPIPTTATPDLGALESVDVTPVSSAGPNDDLTVLDLVAGLGTAVCARRNAAWSCAPPTFAESEGAFHVAGHTAAHNVPSRDGPPWLLVQRSTIEDGGNGEGSGAGGNQFLEIYRDAGGALRPLGALVLGRMEWTTKRRQGHYWRSVARYAHTYAVAGPDCLRIERAIQHRGWADGSFVTAAPPGTDRTRARLPSVLVPGVVSFAGIPTTHQVSQDPSRDVEAEGSGRLVLRDFSGLWCLDADRLVRTSRASPKAKP